MRKLLLNLFLHIIASSLDKIPNKNLIQEVLHKGANLLLFTESAYIANKHFAAAMNFEPIIEQSPLEKLIDHFTLYPHA